MANKSSFFIVDNARFRIMQKYENNARALQILKVTVKMSHYPNLDG